MNAAILYDAMKNAEIEAGDLMSGTPLFSHSLKQFYLHPSIDCVVMVWGETCIDSCALQYIQRWGETYNFVKPFMQFYNPDSLQYVLAKLEEQKKVDLYILHDIRYPCVTSGMIYRVAQKAAIYGVAATTGNIDGDIILTSGNKCIAGNFRYMKYPIAMASNHRVRRKIGQAAEVLELYSGETPYLCNTDEKNPLVYYRDDIKLAEAIASVRQNSRG